MSDVIEISADGELITVSNDTEVLVISEVGMPGPRGADGAPGSTTASFTAAENISSGRVVYLEGGSARHYDPSDENLIGRSLGISKTAALAGDEVTVQLSGIFEMSGMGLTADRLYYSGNLGIPTNNSTGLLILQPIGVSLTADKLLINFTTPIKTIQ